MLNKIPPPSVITNAPSCEIQTEYVALIVIFARTKRPRKFTPKCEWGLVSNDNKISFDNKVTKWEIDTKRVSELFDCLMAQLDVIELC